jgi:membrane-associated phospholipid phosphatase
VVIVLSLVAIGVYLYLRRTRTAALLAITMLGAAVLDLALKPAFHRSRPVTFFGPRPSSYSFPSGHALASVCLYGALAAILSVRARGWFVQFCIWGAALFMAGMIGLSRIYLGVHYPSDVIAGYLAGAVWVCAVGFVDKILIDRRTARTA